MKTILLFMCLSFGFALHAQDPIVQTVGNFDELKVYDLITVNLIPSDEEKVVITGQKANDVEAITKNGVLKIRMKLKNSFDGSNTTVEVHYSDIRIIDGNEGVFISGNHKIKQDKITLKTQEGAHIKLELDVDKVDVKAVTGGIVELRGQTGSQEIKINTGGVFKGKTFESKLTTVSIKAGGEADVYASETCNAKVRAGGDVAIYGKPSTVTEDTALGGRIVRMN